MCDMPIIRRVQIKANKYDCKKPYGYAMQLKVYVKPTKGSLYTRILTSCIA